MTNDKATPRKGLSKKARFEVFKRDSFTCQYCGHKAPDVVLHADHIEPLASGGSSDITNLVTACVDCNLGKSDRRLSDSSVAHARQGQVEALQARREQLEMLMEWHRGLSDLDSAMVTEAAAFWHSLAPGFELNERGLNALRKLLKKYGADPVFTAMQTATRYLEIDSDGNASVESWEKATDYIGRICRVNESAKTDPNAHNIAYIYGILKRRGIFIYKREVTTHNLGAAFSWGITFDQLAHIARLAKHSYDFSKRLNALIDDAQKADQEDA